MTKWYTVITEGNPNEGLTLEETESPDPRHPRFIYLKDAIGDIWAYYTNEVELAAAPDEDYVEETPILPTDAKLRKMIPIYSGLIKYFPDAFAAVAQHSYHGGLQHGQTPETLHWDRTKSTDHLDALMRHVLEKDWEAVAWRALAHLQTEIEEKKEKDVAYIR